MNFSSSMHSTKQDQFPLHKISVVKHSMEGKRILELFQTKTNSFLTENHPIFKNYKTALFFKIGWELKFQPTPDCHDKKIQKQSGYQEKPNFYRSNKFVFSS